MNNEYQLSMSTYEQMNKDKQWGGQGHVYKQEPNYKGDNYQRTPPKHLVQNPHQTIKTKPTKPNPATVEAELQKEEDLWNS
ncbi:hypothetical protein UFOVP964_118 [uncultured Caudovirales phage]|uniref:Uncharacterized protein n=1 Tax=uncultured Caudovirales phage TaxID=2100421 RepID=A0A6J5P5D4_9CAUD|nr:hypothetical protein UFOVP854_118 [uncultured Caudovirales phage]CAB4175076.1 hypothetical protein UFOVP964_118 [uncultured Caudovirales phage]CAB4179161.1 hypothetical protein UFOVP1034_40 [uncultured Caudovirales phage]CAB4189084.1 hypothetical protein UFOVP1177_40 [uncultured Caudovirales phage]CAB4193128.1 hypothetical protein UFOVP1243_27 [uncultured Caudovirales phage]